MNDIKPWYQSKAIWGALIAVGSSVVNASGVDLGVDDQGQLADAAVTLAGTIGGLVALYGRVSAKNRIG